MIYFGQKFAEKNFASLGAKQGCITSPLLFIVYVDRITTEENPDPKILSELHFVDDQRVVNEEKVGGGGG